MTHAAEAATPAPAGAGAGAGLLDITSLLPERTPGDFLSREVRVSLGGAEYVLPVLTIAANRRWKATLEGTLLHVLQGIDSDEASLGQVLAVLGGLTEQMLEALYAYDATGVLPPQHELEEVATDADVLYAVLGVWSAANPFVGVALEAAREALRASRPVIPTPAPSTPTNGSRPPTAGRRATSKSS